MAIPNFKENLDENKMYCGLSDTLPEGYTFFGTRSECLKTGIGVGLGMMPSQREESKIRMENKEDEEDKPKLYCGLSDDLPDGYDDFGSTYDCMKKGIGTGIFLPEEQRKKFIKKKRAEGTRQLTLNELKSFAYRLDLNIDELNRYDLTIDIIYRLLEFLDVLDEDEPI